MERNMEGERGVGVEGRVRSGRAAAKPHPNRVCARGLHDGSPVVSFMPHLCGRQHWDRRKFGLFLLAQADARFSWPSLTLHCPAEAASVRPFRLHCAVPSRCSAVLNSRRNDRSQHACTTQMNDAAFKGKASTERLPHSPHSPTSPAWSLYAFGRS